MKDKTITSWRKVYVDMDGVLCDYNKAFNEKRIPNKMEYPQSQARFFENLEEIDGGVNAFHWLSERFDTWILSSPSIMNPLSYSEKRVWVEEHLGSKFVDRLILSTDKSLFKGQYLIDDNSNTNNQFLFEGELILFGKRPFLIWNDVIEYFKNK